MIITYWIFPVKRFCCIISIKELVKMPKIIVYFSRAGENYVSGALKKLAVGNTQKAAEILREITGADIFKIADNALFRQL